MNNFKLKDEPVWSQDPYYDATDGGRIIPHDLLEDQGLADEVVKALNLVSGFLDAVTFEE